MRVREIYILSLLALLVHKYNSWSGIILSPNLRQRESEREREREREILSLLAILVQKHKY